MSPSTRDDGSSLTACFDEASPDDFVRKLVGRAFASREAADAPEAQLQTQQDMVAEILSQLPHDPLPVHRVVDTVSEVIAAHGVDDPVYGHRGGRATSAFVRSVVPARFSESVRRGVPRLAETVCAFVERHADAIDAAIDDAADDRYDLFAWRTLLRAYLRCDPDRGEAGTASVVETPQYMLMRVAVGIHAHDDDLAAALATYEMLRAGRMSHATPTLFNAGTEVPQLASCFLMTPPSDSVEGIFEALRRSALISKTAGGIGVNVSDVRARGSLVRSTGGTSNGILRMLRVFDATARFVDQGGGKRKGAVAVYLEPWHADVFDFLDMKRPNGKEELRARDLFYALWVPDAFMRAVRDGADWHLFCPKSAPELCATTGPAFDAAYEAAVAEGRHRRVVSARSLWNKIVSVQIETGGPYVLFKDACNAKSNHRHLGPLRCSNLCTEIVQHVSADEVAVCNLASVALPAFLKTDDADRGDGDVSDDTWFDWPALAATVRQVVRNINKNIDHGYYPVEEARRSNFRHRPMGIGVQGLADVYHAREWTFDGERARRFNVCVFETLYYTALSESVREAERCGPYESYAGSPLSEGVLSPDLWGRPLTDERHDWTSLRADLKRHGARNSLLVAPMPTASTAHILGNTEAFEPSTSNLYVRRVLSGEFVCVNRRLVRALKKRGLWTPAMRRAIMARDGSVQGIADVPDHLQQVYRTAWELPQRAIVDMAAERAPFVDQAQSMNLFFKQPDASVITGALFHAWERGLKNGVYYCHSRPAGSAAKVATMGTSTTAAPPPPPTPAAPSSTEETLDEPSSACPMRRRDSGGGDCESCSA